MNDVLGPAYFAKFDHLNMTRSVSGVLEVRFTTDNGPIIFTDTDHREFIEAFSQIARDRDNKIVILTGTGDEFFAQIDGPSLVGIIDPCQWDKTWWEGQLCLQNLADIGVPVIAAINGPATVHSEFALLSDIIIASEKAYFQDYPHLTFGCVARDGVQTVWARAMGEYYKDYFHYTQQRITAAEGKIRGFVDEVLTDNQELMERAYDLAEGLLVLPELTRRHMRGLFIAPLRKALLEQVEQGLAAEGFTATDLKIAAEEKVRLNKIDQNSKN